MSEFQASAPAGHAGLASVLAELTRILNHPERGLDDTLDALLALGCRRLGLDLGVVARVRDSAYDIRALCALTNTPLKVGQTLALDQTFCDQTLQSKGTFSVSHAAHTPLAGHPGYRAYGFESYLGTPIRVNGQAWGTLSFASRDALGRGFGPQDRDFVELLSAILGSELDREETAAKLHAADPAAEHDRLPGKVSGKDRDKPALPAHAAAARAEDELRSMNVRFQAFMRHSPAIKWAVDRDGRFVFVNPAFEQMLAVKSDQCVGRKPEEVMEAKTGKAFGAVARQAEALIESGAEAQTVHVDLPINDRVVPLMVTRFKYTDANGALFLGGSAVDLTDVASVQRELAQRNKDLKALLYVISHDLREPLRAIRNFSGLVVEREYESLGESSKDMLNRVIRGAERLDQLLSDVLTLSRAQRADPASGTVPCGGIIQEVVSDLQATIDRCAAKIDIADGLPELKIDAFWLRQAIHNLVTNALKFTRNGEPPELSIRPYRYGPAGPDQDQPADVDRPMSGLIFEDRGPGVEAHQRERIFGLFQRGVSRDVPGTGAGLAIVAQVAERYGGRVWVEDAPRGGARFILAFYL